MEHSWWVEVVELVSFIMMLALMDGGAMEVEEEYILGIYLYSNTPPQTQCGKRETLSLKIRIER